MPNIAAAPVGPETSPRAPPLRRRGREQADDQLQGRAHSSDPTASVGPHSVYLGLCRVDGST